MRKLTKDLANYTQVNSALWESIKERVLSDLEDSAICLIGRECKNSNLSIMVHFFKPGGNREYVFETMTVLEKTSQIAALPSEELRIIAYTIDLKEEWEWQRLWSFFLAKSFLFSLLVKAEDPFEEEKQAGLITEQDAELIELSSYRYEALYKLISKGLKYLQKSSKNNSINKTNWDIFLEIVREENDFHFEIRTYDFQQFQIATWIPHWKVLADQKIDRENLHPLLETQKIFHSEQLLKILNILIKKSEKDDLLKARLISYFIQCIELGKSYVKSLPARTKNGKIHKSELWKEGQRYIYFNNRPVLYKTLYGLH